MNIAAFLAASSNQPSRHKRAINELRYAKNEPTVYNPTPRMAERVKVYTSGPIRAKIRNSEKVNKDNQKHDRRRTFFCLHAIALSGREGKKAAVSIICLSSVAVGAAVAMRRCGGTFKVPQLMSFASSQVRHAVSMQSGYDRHAVRCFEKSQHAALWTSHGERPCQTTWVGQHIRNYDLTRSRPRLRGWVAL